MFRRQWNPLFIVIAGALLSASLSAGTSRSSGRGNGERFTHTRPAQTEAATPDSSRRGPRRSRTGSGDVNPDQPVAEALTGFDSLTNGFSVQGPAYGTLDEGNVVAGRSFNDNRFIFEAVEEVEDGIGPTYNAQSCRECHQNVATGGASQVTVHRSGRLTDGVFFDSPGGSLIHSRATNPEIQEHVPYDDTIRTFRISTNTLGDGYVEAIANETLLAIRDSQPEPVRGTAITVPVLEGDGTGRLGRFGWKNQHASLETFAADAYLNEMGITSPLFPEENSAGDLFVGFGSGFDPVPELEDDGEDVRAFADFMRATKAPSRGPVTPDVTSGEAVFADIGCATCHVSSITTAAPGTVVNGGAFVVPNALGNKVIHPYSDFLVHDVGTGDGIPVLPTAEYAGTAVQMRTAPLWGLRTRNRLMHDGLAFSLEEAIVRHQGQATSVTGAYLALPAGQKAQLLSFLNSL